MMTTLYVASNYVLSSPWGPWGHLQIVAKDSSGDYFETEVQSPHYIPFDWDVFNDGEREHNASTTPGFDDNDLYRLVEIDLNPEGVLHERTAADVWSLILQASTAIEDAYIPYTFFQNSNSYVNTLLESVGIDLSELIPALTMQLGISFPSSGRNIADFLPLTATTGVHYDVVGTDGSDLFWGGWGNDYIGGGLGDDFLGDGRGSDVIEGGAGNDFILLGAGDEFQLLDDFSADIIIVGEGNTEMVGGGSSDRLVIRGDLLGLASYAPGEEPTTAATGLGPAAASLSIPLLGGFYSPDDGLSSAYYMHTLQQIESSDYFFRKTLRPIRITKSPNSARQSGPSLSMYGSIQSTAVIAHLYSALNTPSAAQHLIFRLDI